MTPLFIYKKQIPGADFFLVRELGDRHDKPPEDYDLVASIEPRMWLQCWLNYEQRDRDRMVRDLEGKK